MNLLSLLRNYLSPFNLPRNNVSPNKNVSTSKKMVLAINSGDFLSVEEMLQSGYDVNSRLHEQGGNRALHLACVKKKSNIKIVKKLFEFRADPFVRNDFELLPIHEGGNVEIVKYLLENHNTDCDSIDEYWHFCLTEDTLHKHMIRSDIFALLLIAIPCFSNYAETTREKIFKNAFLCNYYTCMKLMLIFGEKMEPRLVNKEPNTDEEKEFFKWIENFKTSGAPTLQHISRIAVRKSINRRHNVIYAVEKLDLPKELKQFLKFTDFTPCGL